jgi:hypothetical protein
MDDEFKKLEANRQSAVQVQDRSDFTAELNGTDNGRMKRFGLDGKHQRDKTRKEREKQSLAQALKISAAYAKLYNSTMQDLHDVTSAVYEAQLLASMALEKAQGLLQQTLDEASMTPNNVAVFRSEDGAIYDQHGQKVDDDTLLSVFWREGAPSWETYQDRKNDVKTKLGRFDLMNKSDMQFNDAHAKPQNDAPLNLKGFDI